MLDPKVRLPAATFLADALADLEPLGLVERNGAGWHLTSVAELRYGPALRELDVACLELETLGCPREHAIVVLLRGIGEQIAEDRAIDSARRAMVSPGRARGPHPGSMEAAFGDLLG